MEDCKNNNILIILIKGIFVSIICTLFMILVLSIILSMSNINESVIMPSVVFISSFCILIGSFMMARKIDKKGIVYGSILGISYMGVLYIISSIINLNFSLNIHSLIMIIIGVFGGAVGGILGVNLK